MSKYKDPSQRLRSETILAKTGKSLEDWFTIIENFGGREKGHTATAKYLQENFDTISVWWAQSLTVAYEYKHGLREVNKRDKGYEFSLQRTVPIGLEDAYQSFTDKQKLNHWLSPHVEINLFVGGRFNFDGIAHFCFEKIIPEKLLRLEMTYAQNGHKTKVDIEFLPKNEEKTAVRISNSRLQSAEELEINRTYWVSVLEAFRNFVKGA